MASYQSVKLALLMACKKRIRIISDDQCKKNQIVEGMLYSHQNLLHVMKINQNLNKQPLMFIFISKF